MSSAQPVPVIASSAVRALLVGPVRSFRVVASYAQAHYLEVEHTSGRRAPGRAETAPAETASAATARAETRRAATGRASDAHAGAREGGVPPRPRLVALVAPGGVAVPGSVRVAPVAAGWWPASSAIAVRIGGGALEVDGVQLRVQRWWDPRPALAATTRAALASRLDRLDSRLDRLDRLNRLNRLDRLELSCGRAAASPAAGVNVAFDPTVHPLGPVLAACRAGDLVGARGAADALLGRGPGLTPTGDDLLAGFLGTYPHLRAAVGHERRGSASGIWATAAIDRVVRDLGTAVAERAPTRTTAVSAALLDHASRGELAAPFVQLLRALGGRGDLDEALDAALAVGSSSGVDLTRGVLAAGRLALACAAEDGPVAVHDAPLATVGVPA